MARPINMLFIFAVILSTLVVPQLCVLFQYPNGVHNSLMGSKTTYHNAFSLEERQRRDNVFRIASPFCRPIQVNAVIRHGIRNPGKKDIANINALYNKLKTHSSVDADVLDALYPQFHVHNASQLAKTGSKEQYDIATRLAKRYNNLLRSASVDQLTFISSNISRTIDSSNAFISAFREMGYNVSNKIEIRNDLMRFYDICKRYLVSVETSQSALQEFYTFRNGNVINHILRNLHTRLGLESNVNINIAELKAAYVIGAVHEAVFGELSPWSRLLTINDLRVLEYAADLKSYWKKAYGHQINYQQSCELLQHIMQNLDSAVTRERWAKKGIFRFGHAETLLPLLSLLGLFRDARPLTADNFSQQARRRFRTSRIAPFSANLAFVLYECDLDACGDRCEHYERHMVEMLFNELPLPFPFCEQQLCAYSTVRAHYEQHVAGCDVEQLCALHSEL